MTTFIVVKLNLGYHILLQPDRSIMRLFFSTLKDLGKLGIDVIT
jgi:hypothetical protein